MTAIIEDRLNELVTGGTLAKGSHTNFVQGACAMEWVSYLAGEGFTDAPECASQVLRLFTINVNDQWGDDERQKLVPLLPRMVGTGYDGKDESRSYMALDWLIRTYTPAWLDLAGFTAEAQALRDLPRIVDIVSAEAAGPVVRAVRDKASASQAAARGAGVAAGAAAWDAAWDAGAAAWDAGAAARAAARDAGAAARATLRPTMETLQASALELLENMIDPMRACDAL